MVDYVLSAATTQGPGPTTIVTSPTSTEALPGELPPVVRESLDAPTPKPHGWLTTIAPAFLGVVVWFPLLDGFGQAGATGDVLARWATGCLALIACYALVYLPLAGLGLRERRRLPVVAAGALGADGAEWIAGVLHGLFAGVWGSVAIWYSVRMTLDGLIAWGLLEPAAAKVVAAGGGALESPLVLIALAFWSFIIVAAVGINLTAVITALMRVYWPFSGLVLTVAAVWACWWGIPWKSQAVAGSPLEPRVFQYIFAAFAFAGLMAVDWGGAVRDRRDVRLGGFVGLLGSGALTLLAASILAAVGAGGSIRSALGGRIFGPQAGGALLLLFGLASLAPAIFSADLFRSRFRHHWPMLRGRVGALLGFLILFLMGRTAEAHIETVAGISGALFAPLAGILMVESFRRSPGVIRPGWSIPGVAAWGLGAAVGLAPIVGESVGASWPGSFPPAALMGYLASAIAYIVLSPSAKAGS